MSDILQKMLPRGEPSLEPKWPEWITEALAYKPESPRAVLDPPPEAVSLDSDERRNIRMLSRVSNA